MRMTIGCHDEDKDDKAQAHPERAPRMGFAASTSHCRSSAADMAPRWRASCLGKRTLSTSLQSRKAKPNIRRHGLWLALSQLALSFVSMRGFNNAQVLCRAHLQVLWKLLKCGAILKSIPGFRDG